MAAKWIGLGTVFKVDENDDAANHTAITLVMSGTPPPRTRVRIPAVALSDTLATDELGIEGVSDFVFTQFWEPGDTQHESIDTLFGSKAEVEWQIVYTSGETDEWNGKVVDIVPQAIVHDGVYQRQVTVHRTGAITRTVA